MGVVSDWGLFSIWVTSSGDVSWRLCRFGVACQRERGAPISARIPPGRRSTGLLALRELPASCSVFPESSVLSLSVSMGRRCSELIWREISNLYTVSRL